MIEHVNLLSKIESRQLSISFQNFEFFLLCALFQKSQVQARQTRKMTLKRESENITTLGQGKTEW